MLPTVNCVRWSVSQVHKSLGTNIHYAFSNVSWFNNLLLQPKPFPFPKEKPYGFLALDSGVVNEQNAPLCLLAVDLNLNIKTVTDIVTLEKVCRAPLFYRSLEPGY